MKIGQTQKEIFSSDEAVHHNGGFVNCHPTGHLKNLLLSQKYLRIGLT